MSFKDFIGTLAKELGAEIEIDNALCAISLGAAEGDRIDILLQGFDRRGVLLATADLGEAPPEGREALYKTLLEANDLFAGTLGATLSLNPANGRVRLQRFDDMDALRAAGVRAAFTVFADTAAVWKRFVADFRGDGDAPPPPDFPGGAIRV
jgi:hypothetical protein